MLLNHEPGEARPTAEEVGRGERYFRFQVALEGAIEMDDASWKTLHERLPRAAARLIEERRPEIEAVVERLAPIPAAAPAPA
jgi:hypothetical protein